MIHHGDLIITEENKHLYTELTSVGGSLYVRAPFTAPELTSVGGWLAVDASFTAPELASAAYGLFVRAAFTAPELATVGGSLEVSADFEAPKLTSVGGSLEVNAPFTAPELTAIEGENTSTHKYLLDLRWPVLVTDGFIRIGCQRHTKGRWAEFTDAQIERMDGDAIDFWCEHKEQILAL